MALIPWAPQAELNQDLKVEDDCATGPPSLPEIEPVTTLIDDLSDISNYTAGIINYDPAGNPIGWDGCKITGTTNIRVGAIPPFPADPFNNYYAFNPAPPGALGPHTWYHIILDYSIAMPLYPKPVFDNGVYGALVKDVSLDLRCFSSITLEVANVYHETEAWFTPAGGDPNLDGFELHVTCSGPLFVQVGLEDQTGACLSLPGRFAAHLTDGFNLVPGANPDEWAELSFDLSPIPAGVIDITAIRKVHVAFYPLLIATEANIRVSTGAIPGDTVDIYAHHLYYAVRNLKASV